MTSDSGVCPLCRRGQITFYQDSHLPIDRYSCRSCKKSGDLLDLIVNFYSIKRNVAIEQLKQLSPKIGEFYESRLELIERNHRISTIAANAWRYFQGDRANAVSHPTVNLILKMLKTEIRGTLSWMENGVSQILGYGTAEDFETWMRLKSPDELQQIPHRSEYKHIAPSLGGVLVMPICTSPDLIEGLQAIYLDHKKLRTRIAWFPYSGIAVRSGLTGHPEVLQSRDKVCVVDSSQLALKLQIDNLLRTDKPCDVVSIVGGDDTAIPENLQLLTKRECVFWSPNFKPSSLRRASHLDAKISTVGDTAADMLRWLTNIGPEQFLNRVRDTSVQWYTAAGKQIDRQGVTHGAELVQAAHLSSTEIHSVLQSVKPEIRDAFQAAVQPSWPNKRIAMTLGVVEQRTSSWWYIRGDREELITDAPFRIIQVEVDKKGEHWYLIEVSFNNAKYRLRVPRLTMLRSPMQTIQTKFIEDGLGVTAYANTWESRAMHICQQMYSNAQLKTATPVGVNVPRNSLQLSNVFIDLTTGRMSKNTTAVSGSLFPEADGTVINPEHIHRLAEDWFSCRAVLATVLHWICEIRGAAKPLVVLTSDAQITAGRRFLSDVGLINRDIADYRNAYQVLHQIDEHSVTKTLDDDCRWLACSRPVSWYYGGLRTIIELGDPNNNPPLSPKDLQEIVVGLLTVYARKFASERDPHTALIKAWNWCLRRTECSPGKDTTHFPVTTIDKTLQAIINEGIRTELWTVASKRPSRPELCNIWLDRSNQWMTFTKASINYTFQTWKLPRWDSVDVLSQLMMTEFFKQMIRVGSRSCWQVRTHGIDFTARKEARRRVKNA